MLKRPHQYVITASESFGGCTLVHTLVAFRKSKGLCRGGYLSYRSAIVTCRKVWNVKKVPHVQPRMSTDGSWLQRRRSGSRSRLL